MRVQASFNAHRPLPSLSLFPPVLCLQALQSARQARRAARLEAEREASSVLPPLSHYYAGKVHERIVAEQHEQKRKVEIQREVPILHMILANRPALTAWVRPSFCRKRETCI